MYISCVFIRFLFSRRNWKEKSHCVWNINVRSFSSFDEVQQMNFQEFYVLAEPAIIVEQ